MQMRSGGPAGRTDIADQLSLLDRVAGGDHIVCHMRIDTGISVAMVDRHIIAVRLTIGCTSDRAALRRVDLRVHPCGQIDTVMETLIAVDRMDARSVGTSHTRGIGQREREAAGGRAARRGRGTAIAAAGGLVGRSSRSGGCRLLLGKRVKVIRFSLLDLLADSSLVGLCRKELIRK